MTDGCSINGSFRFHGVGQGLFYSGLLNLFNKGKHKVFSFVYDCGSFSDKRFLRSEIDSFKALLPASPSSKSSKKLDLLVVSHMHDDHLNGLEKLLENVDVDTVVMPYLDKGRRLLARLESQETEAFLQEFLLDPISWFSTKGVHRILLIGAEECAEDITQEDIRDQREDDASSLRWEGDDILQREAVGSTEILYMRKNTIGVSKQFLWKFCFLNVSQEYSVRYRDTVENYLRKETITLEQLFQSKRKRDGLKRRLLDMVYRKSEINRSSVLLLHCPSIPSSRNHSDIPTTLLTGDIEFSDNDLEDPDCDICKIGDKDCSFHSPCSFDLIQYPHHGAQPGIDYPVERMLCRLRRKMTCKQDKKCPLAENEDCRRRHHSVISYGLVNRYGHPYPDITERLSRWTYLHEVNELQGFSYRISFVNEKYRLEHGITNVNWDR